MYFVYELQAVMLLLKSKMMILNNICYVDCEMFVMCNLYVTKVLTAPWLSNSTLSRRRSLTSSLNAGPSQHRPGTPRELHSTASLTSRPPRERYRLPRMRC